MCKFLYKHWKYVVEKFGFIEDFVFLKIKMYAFVF